MRQFQFDVFLSYNAGDAARVIPIADCLRTAGYNVWFDKWTIRAGDDIYLAVENGLDRSRVQVLCLSRKALASGWVTLERNTVLFRDPGNAQRRFIPVLISDCELPDTLRRYKYIDFRDESPQARADLIAACRPESPTQPAPALRRQSASQFLRDGAAQTSRLAGVRELPGHN